MSTPVELYNVLSKYFLLVPPLVFPPYFFIDAPFGRFSPSKASILLVDGIKSWIIMELVSPIGFLATFLSSPLTRPLSSLKRFPISPPQLYTLKPILGLNLPIPIPNPPTILVLLFLTHYANRALISPLRTPSRAKSHIVVPIFAVTFNSVNGTLMGAFLAALASTSGRSGNHTLVADWKFWLGVSMWAVGFAGNIYHDEILLDIRRNSKKDKKQQSEKSGEEKTHYAIPHGGLYGLISYPNYFSEWVEWIGYGIAATALTSQLPLTHVIFPFAPGHLSLGAFSQLPFIQRLTPPWLFLFSELFLMFPRAWNGHKWYQKKFPNYPSQRKAVIPFLL